ncbi:RNA-guided endonuclease InsQ/TnpB family protein [Micromonospora purpureochromogenes]|nr:RNA-guided endonuclease TnpB family protein [Micromonospora purpureochromogenes]
MGITLHSPGELPRALPVAGADLNWLGGSAGLTAVRRAYKFLLRPTKRQAAALTACLEDHRQIYNAALAERREAYRRAGVCIRYTDQSAQLKEIRSGDPCGQGRWSFSSQQATLRRLDKAMRGFFERVKADHRPGHPRFKGIGRFNSVEWPKDRDGCRWDSAPDTGGFRVYLQAIGHIRVHAHRTIQGKVKTVGVKREGRRWFLLLSCDEVPTTPLPPTGGVVGIDMGLTHFLTTSEGKHVENPRCLDASRCRLAEAQRALGRCQRGSNRRRKVRERLAGLHSKVRRQRLDHAHKTALQLVKHYDLIAHEDLPVSNMVRSAGGSRDQPGINVRAKASLNKAILDAGWAAFLSILSAKAESAGRTIVAVNPRNTSRTCPACGHCASENRVSQSRFACISCGYLANADVVGAINIHRAGLARRVGPAPREAGAPDVPGSHIVAGHDA